MVKRKHLLVVAVVVAAAGFFIWLTLPSPEDGKQSGANSSASTFNKQQFPTDESSSIWVVVNKKRPLQPADYTPASLAVPDMPLRLKVGNEEMQLSSVMIPALLQMVDAAKKDGINYMLASGYRSYNFQKNLYNGYVRSSGQAEADKTSARAGHSEHQTGLAVDLEPTNRQCEIEACFGQLPEGRWLAANSWRYGFIIRYAQGSEDVTGYEYEPWHVRYVGNELAAEMHNKHITTLEAFFTLPGGPNY